MLLLIVVIKPDALKIMVYLRIAIQPYMHKAKQKGFIFFEKAYGPSCFPIILKTTYPVDGTIDQGNAHKTRSNYWRVPFLPTLESLFYVKLKTRTSFHASLPAQLEGWIVLFLDLIHCIKTFSVSSDRSGSGLVLVFIQLIRLNVIKSAAIKTPKQ